MLNKDQMSPQEFETWKEANSFLFDYLKELQSKTTEDIEGCAKQVLICPDAQMNHLRMHCAGLVGFSQALKDIIELEYTDIVEKSK